MKEDKDGEKTKVNSRLKTFLYKNKFIFDLFMKFRARLIALPLEEEIRRLQQEGKETIIIDDIFIKYQKRYKDLSKIFLLERPYTERKEAVMRRDNLTKEEIVAADTAHFRGNYKEVIHKNNVFKINNSGTQDELRQQAKQIYKEHFAGFKDRYKKVSQRVEVKRSENKDIEMEIKTPREEREK